MGLEAFALPLSLAVGALGASWLLDAALARAAADDEPLAVRTLVGIAVLTPLAGAFVAMNAYSRGVSLALLALAGAGWLARRHAPRMRGPSPSLWARAAWLGCLAFALARTVLGLRFTQFNPCDDWVAYLHFPRLLLESGGFEEPFGMRRLGVLGAGPFLQGFFWPAWGVAANPLADAVFGVVATVGGALALHRELAEPPAPRASAPAFVGVALLATLVVPHINTLPTLLPFGGALLLYALHARLALGDPQRATAARDAVCFGVLAAWLIGLRVSNAVVPALLWSFLLVRALRERARLRQVAIAAAATALALAPWCLSLLRSSGTPLFPLLRGNYRFATVFSEPLSNGALLGFVSECLATSRVPWLVGLAAVTWLARRELRGVALDLALAAIGLVAATAVATSAFDSFVVQRYCAPFVIPALLALGVAALASGSAAWRSHWRTAAVLAIAAAWLFIPVKTRVAKQHFSLSLSWLGAGYATAWLESLQRFAESPFARDEFLGSEPYLEAQRLLPRGARVVSAAEQAYLWRHDTQVVHGLDLLGQVSPAPGMPFFRGAESVADYFVSLGYTHLAFTPPHRGICIYSEKHWLDHLANGQWMWRQWAPYFLDFMATQRELARTRRVLYRAPTLVVLDLRARAARP